MRFIFLLFSLCFLSSFANASFWIEATDMEAMVMINRGLIEVGQGMIPDSFDTYGRCFHHLETGKKYWKIKTIVLPHTPYIIFDVEGWFIDSYPSKTIFEPEYIYELARQQYLESL